MSKTETKTETKTVRKRSVLGPMLRTVAKEIAERIALAGALLDESRFTFPEKQRGRTGPDGKPSEWIRWAENQTGWKPAYVYRVMQAARVLSETPSAEKIRDVDGIVALDRLTPENRKKVLKEIGTNPSAQTVRETADRIQPKKQNGKGRSAQDAEKIAKRIGALAKKHKDAVLMALETGPDDRQGLLILGARLAGKIGADAPAVLAEIFAEYAPLTEETSEETSETETTS